MAILAHLVSSGEDAPATFTTAGYVLVDINDEASAIYDLWLQTHFRHFIIANSTFSWWGAWLSNRPGKVVVAPSVRTSGVSDWGFDGLIPDTWITL